MFRRPRTPLAQRMIELRPVPGVQRPNDAAKANALIVLRRLETNGIEPKGLEAYEGRAETLVEGQRLRMGGVVIFYERRGAKAEAVCLNNGSTFEVHG